jgi:hypothetical protein
VTERRADPGCNREHRGDPRNDGQVDFTPFPRPGFDRLADGRGHGEDAWIAAGNDRDFLPLRRLAERCLSARNFLAVIRGDANLVRPQLDAVEIGAIAIEEGGVVHGRAGLGRHLTRIARPKPDNRNVPAHGLPAHPGTRTIEK